MFVSVVPLNIETGSFVFRNNRNKQKTNRNSSKFVKISTFLIPLIISSVCFGCSIPVRNIETKLKKNFLVLLKSTPKNNRNKLSFGLFRFVRFLEIFSVCFGCFDTGPKHRNKPKKCFLVSQNKPKNNRNRLSFGLFRFEPKKKIWLFRGHPTSNTPRGSPATTGDETEQHDQPIERTKYSEHSDWSESD